MELRRCFPLLSKTRILGEQPLGLGTQQLDLGTQNGLAGDGLSCRCCCVLLRRHQVVFRLCDTLL